LVSKRAVEPIFERFCTAEQLGRDVCKAHFDVDEGSLLVGRLRCGIRLGPFSEAGFLDCESKQMVFDTRARSELKAWRSRARL